MEWRSKRGLHFSIKKIIAYEKYQIQYILKIRTLLGWSKVLLVNIYYYKHKYIQLVQPLSTIPALKHIYHMIYHVTTTSAISYKTLPLLKTFKTQNYF